MTKSFSVRRWSLPTALVLFIALIWGSPPAAAEPGLWRAKGPNATIYLFGTVHVLRKGMAWKSPAIANALAASQELWLEVPDPDNVQAVQPLIAQLGADPQHPLSTKLSPDALAHLDTVAKSIGMREGEQGLEPMRPWLAAVALEDALIVRAGYDPKSGVEPLLLHEAQAAGKPVHGFETLDQQMHFFANMSPRMELDLLENTLEDFDQGAGKLDALVDAWAKGDDAAITRATVDELRNPFPELYRTIVVERNDAWADSIVQMLKGTGVKFIAVGAAHLAGPDSVQAALKQRGVAVERIRTSP